VRQFAKQQGVTPFVALLAGFSALLARYTGCDDLVIGSAMAGRNRRELEPLLGFFVNTVPLRIDCSRDPSFRELVARARAICFEAFAHQDMPFERLVELGPPVRDPSRTPLFQVFIGENPTWPGLELPALSVRSDDAPFGTATFDLSLFVQNTPEITVTWEFSTALFDEQTIRRLDAHCMRLLAAAIAEPDRPISQLEMLSDAERHVLLVDWNPPLPAANEATHGEAEDANLGALFEAQVERTPEAIALVLDDRELTYRELDDWASQVARRLRAQSGSPGSLVAICTADPLEAVVGVLAIVKTGAAYVPLDPSYPAKRLASMISDAKPIAVLGAGIDALVPGVPILALEDRAVDDDSARTPVRSTERVPEHALAYVIYTSGSTGAPKGVMISNGAIVRRLAYNHRFFALGVGDTVAQTASLGVDASVLQIFTALTCGARLALIRATDRADPERLAHIVATSRVTLLDVVPSLLAALLEEPTFDDVSSLRHVVCGGEPLPASVRDRFLKRFPTLPLHNFYGPTECTVDVTVHTCTPDDAGKPVLIGRPFDGARIYVVDPRDRLAPSGVPGEIWIGGDYVARGYLGNDAATAERFVPDPFSNAPDARAYRTGDLGRWRAGELELIGRADHQVKIRGFRIELGEIEVTLAEHPGVRACAVVVMPVQGAPQLVAHIVPDGRPASQAELRAHLKKTLPEHMVPGTFVLVDALPRTPSGKVDRQALPLPTSTREPGSAARTAMEAVVGEIWERVLKRDGICAHDNFFTLGGHSLLATQVISRLRRELGISVPVQLLFEAPTLAGFALAVQARMVGKAVPPLAPCVVMPRSDEVPLSFAQQRLWFLDRLEPDGFTYNVPVFLRLEGALRVDLLERSLHEIVRRHEVLRTRFVEADGKVAQVVAPMPMLVHPIAVDNAQGASHVADEWTRREARRPFVLAEGPLLRARLLRLAPDEHVLSLAMHHIICDDWSIGLLTRELERIYTALLRGLEPALPPVRVQYADYAIWQRTLLSSETLAGQLAYWTEHLAGAPELLALPTDRPRPAVQTTRGAMVETSLAPEIVTAARALSRQAGVTLFMTLLAAYYVLLQRYTGQSDLVVGSPIAGRSQGELEDVLGFFVNSLALRVRLEDDASFRALLSRVRDTCLRAYAHQDVPFERVVEAMRPTRDPSYTPLFQVMFVLQNAPVSNLELPGLAVEPLYVHPGMAKFDLTLFVYETDDGLETKWEYNADLFDRATVQGMAGHYARLVDELVRHPEERPSTTQILSAAQRDAILAHGTGARTSYPTQKSLHELFEDQVARRPDATAVIFGERALSYATLNERVNRLARYLAHRGVSGGDRVGVCLGRSTDFIVSILAVIKLGACYVPLDPAHPVDRLAYMADDAEVRVLIARSWPSGAGARLAPRFGDVGHTAGEALVPSGEAPAGPSLSGDVVWLDGAEAEVQQLSGANIPVTATSTALAYVMYTSGSTGRPKGTCIEQRSVAALVLGTDYVALDHEDVVAHLSNTSFDAATFEIWGALLNGASLYGFAPDVVMSPDALAQEIRASGVTAILITTAPFNQLAAAVPSALQGIDHSFFGGETADVDAVRRIQAAGAPRRLVHLYGPTETTAFATWHLVGEIDQHAATIPIGRPIANARIRILDQQRKLVPIGVRGEIYIGGDGVARGYWNRPELTAERFIADPFEPGGRLYRTGDLGAWRRDGTIEFHGRADHQVKVRGFRIELGEIEAQLLAQPDVSEAIVLVRDYTGDKRLVAYVVPTAGASLEVDHVRARLAATLPQYMIPSAIVALERLPITPNGKVDRRMLPAPSLRRIDLGGDYCAPQGELEQAIGRIYAGVLGVDRVGATDNFFDLGGTSFLLVSVRSRIEALVGRKVPIVALFQFAQVRALAAHLSGVDEDSFAEPAPSQRAQGARRLADRGRGRTIES
jgi:amino acid adenylation domain-containing protein